MSIWKKQKTTDPIKQNILQEMGECLLSHTIRQEYDIHHQILEKQRSLHHEIA